MNLSNYLIAGNSGIHKEHFRSHYDAIHVKPVPGKQVPIFQWPEDVESDGGKKTCFVPEQIHTGKVPNGMEYIRFTRNEWTENEKEYYLYKCKGQLAAEQDRFWTTLVGKMESVRDSALGITIISAAVAVVVCPLIASPPGVIAVAALIGGVALAALAIAVIAHYRSSQAASECAKWESEQYQISVEGCSDELFNILLREDKYPIPRLDEQN